MNWWSTAILTSALVTSLLPTAAVAIDSNYYSYQLPEEKPTVISTQKKMEQLKKYDAAIVANPRDYVAFYNRGRMKSFGKDLRGALVDFDSSLRVNPLKVNSAKSPAGEPRKIRAWAHQERGLVLCQLKRYKAGIDSISSAIAIRPNFADNYQNRAAAYWQLGQIDLSQKDTAKAAELRKLKLFDDCKRVPEPSAKSR